MCGVVLCKDVVAMCLNVCQELGNMFYGTYCKIPKNSDIRKIAVIVLKFELCGSTIEQ